MHTYASDNINLCLFVISIQKYLRISEQLCILWINMHTIQKNVRQIAKNVKQITSVAAKSAMSAVGRNDMRMGL